MAASFSPAIRIKTLIHRHKPGPDQATPSGNGIAVIALQRLGHVLGEQRYLLASERALTLIYSQICGQAAAYPSLLLGLQEYMQPPAIAIIRGPEQGFGPWRTTLANRFLPNAMTIFLSNGSGPLPSSLAKPESPDVNAWLCHGVNCINAVNTPDKLISLCKSAPGD